MDLCYFIKYQARTTAHYKYACICRNGFNEELLRLYKRLTIYQPRKAVIKPGYGIIVTFQAQYISTKVNSISVLVPIY